MSIESFELAPGVVVPRIVVGLWQLSTGHRGGQLDRTATIDALERCVEAGLDTFDAADIYTGVEELLGRLARRMGGRSRIRVHTKFVPDAAALPTIDRHYVERIVDRSLARLGVEAIDLVQFSWWDYQVPGYVETLGWLGELQREGKIRLVGTTNFDPPRLRELANSGVQMVSHQVQYSLLDRRPEHALVRHCLREGASLLCYGTLAGGFLSERWLEAADARDRWSNRSLQKYRLIIDGYGGWEAFQDLLRALHRIAIRRQVSIANVAARAVLERPGVGAILVGARDARHLEDNLRTLQMRLEAEDRQTIESLLSRNPGPQGDVFGLERIPGGPHAALMRTDLNKYGRALE